MRSASAYAEERKVIANMTIEETAFGTRFLQRSSLVCRNTEIDVTTTAQKFDLQPGYVRKIVESAND